MAHVTTFRFTAAAGKRDAVLEEFKRWERERKPTTEGFERSVLVGSNSNPDEFMAVVQFDTTENYQKNSDDAGTDEWFRGLRANLAGDPEWFDGTVALETTA